MEKVAKNLGCSIDEATRDKPTVSIEGRKIHFLRKRR